MDAATDLETAAHRLVDRLPEGATWDDLMYEIYVRQAVDQGLADVAADRTVSADEARAELLGLRDVAALSEAELAEFRCWYAEFDAAAWDRRIATDAAAGRLDRFVDEAPRSTAPDGRARSDPARPTACTARRRGSGGPTTHCRRRCGRSRTN